MHRRSVILRTSERRGEEGMEGGMVEVDTWLPGLPGWHRGGSEG